MTDSSLDLKVWALADDGNPEIGLAHQATKERFWRGPIYSEQGEQARWLDTHIDQNAERFFAQQESNPCGLKPVREGDPTDDYDHVIAAHMDHRTPQFNLRNVMRLILDQDMEYIEWSHIEITDRRGFMDDLAEVRSARIDPPRFESQTYSSMAVLELQAINHELFIHNDWEQWYGEDKKRAAGAMWRYVPEDGGKRTRPFPKDMRVTPHKYWKGRLITEDY